MEEGVLEKIDDDRLEVFVVWLRLLSKDNYELALEQAHLMPDPRVKQYWEPQQALAWEYGSFLDFPPDYQHKFAVDVFLLFKPQVTWEYEKVPVPDFWMHKLGEDERRLDIDTLRRQVEGMLAGG